MTEIDGVSTVEMPAHALSGFDVSVQWLEGSGYWLITISEPYHDSEGRYHVGPAHQVHFGLGEAENAYQAMMLALSDYRRDH